METRHFDDLKLCDIPDIISKIESDGYVINSLRVDFIHDDAIQIAPREYSGSQPFLEDLQKTDKDNDDFEYIEDILYTARRECSIRKGSIDGFPFSNGVWKQAEFTEKVSEPNKNKDIKKDVKKKKRNFIIRTLAIAFFCFLIGELVGIFAAPDAEVSYTDTSVDAQLAYGFENYVLGYGTDHIYNLLDNSLKTNRENTLRLIECILIIDGDYSWAAQ